LPIGDIYGHNLEVQLNRNMICTHYLSRNYHPALESFFENYKAFKKKQTFENSTQDQEIKLRAFFYDDIEHINACPDKVVIIDSLHEGHFTSSLSYSMYDKSKHYIIFTNWFDQEKFTLPINYTPVWHNYFLFDIAQQYYAHNQWYFYTDKIYNFELPKPCLFAHISNSDRTHRNVIRDRLVNDLDSNDFIFRYQGIDSGRNINGIDIVSTGMDIVSQFNNKYVERDVYWRTYSSEVYNMAHFHLVLESYFDSTVHAGFLISEKTVKPLLVGQPFVIAAVPGFLKYLKSLGFYTFDSLWDESYDQETDDHTRSNMIADLCVKLKDFDWENNQTKLQNICNLNRLNFLNISKLAEQEFVQYENALKILPILS